MLTLQIIALVLLGVSAVLLFGPQLIVYGPKALREMVREGQVQFAGGCVTSLVMLVFAAPYIGSAFQSGGGAVTLVMIDIFTMQFSLV
ncbi:MAG: hypothetical protein AAFP81_09590 [Pseudomonadota bacterium]